MATKVGEFFVELAVDTLSGELSVKRLISAIGELEVKSLGGAIGIAKMAQGLYSVAEAATKTAVELTALHEITGVDTKMTQQWQRAAERIGISARSIVGGIEGVHKMIGSFRAGEGIPAELTGRFGIMPLKKDVKGNLVNKDFFDIVNELARSKKYASYEDSSKQKYLSSALPGIDSGDSFRLIEAIRKNKIKFDATSGLSGKQIDDLTNVDREWTNVRQQVTDIFQKFITAGDVVANILKGASAVLESINKLLDAKGVKGAAKEYYQNVMDPHGMDSLWDLLNAGHENDLAGAMLLTQKNRLSLATAGAGGGAGDWRGRLEVQFKDAKGQNVGEGQAFLDRKVSNMETSRATVQLNNGGRQ